MTEPPPGWYPSPDAREASRYRYWDGSRWTEHLWSVPPKPKPARWIRVLRWGGIAFVAAPVVALGAYAAIGITVSMATGNNCVFDPPPGDVTTMTLVNDTRGPVEFVECNNASCSQFDHIGNGDGDIVAAGQADRYWNHEDCGREPVGIRDSTGLLLGCIILPVDDPPKVTTWRVSQRVRCSGPVG